MENIHVNGTELHMNGSKYEFHHNISTIKQIQEFIIVLLFDSYNKSIDISKQPLNNIYVLNNQGEIVWNIRDVIGKEELFVAIGIDEAGHLEATSFYGIKYVLDVKKRNVIERKTVK